MHRQIILAALCVFGGATAAQAEIYRCVIDGRTTFRDKPCPAEERQSTVTNPAQAFAGCYAIDYAGWESGHRTEVMRVANGSGGHYTMTASGDASKPPATIEMRRATPAELRDATRLLKFEASDGIVMVVPAATPNMPALPVGLYKGRDEYRDIRYFFFGYMANGWAKPVPCPPAQ